jgi:hypothetical protein
MGKTRSALRAVALAAVMGLVAAVQAAPPAAAEGGGRPAVTQEAGFVAEWVRGTRDNAGRPFAIVDKKAALLFVYAPDGHLLGATPVLLGMGLGDHSVPGVGDLPPARIPPADRTTPAGRFATEAGRNLDGEAGVWFDYDAGLAIHRLRADAARAARLQRLESRLPGAQRVSAGCVVVPVAFYESLVEPLLGRRRGVVYVLPEMQSMRDVFAGMDRRQPADAGE